MTRGLLLGAATLLLSATMMGCTPSPRATALRVSFADPASYDRATAVELSIHGGNCAALGDSLYTDTFARDGSGEPPLALKAGVYAFRAVARDASCEVVAVVCEDHALPLPDGEVLSLTVAPSSSGPGCEAAACTCGGCDCGPDGCGLSCAGDGGILPDGGVDGGVDGGGTDGGVVIPGPRSLEVGATHSCAVLASGEAVCWGNGKRFALGFDNGGVNQPTPDTPVGGATPLDGFSRLFVGGRAADGMNPTEATTCGIRGGELWCWGDNTEGQLGRAGNAQANPPARVAGFPDDDPIVDAAAGLAHTCAVTASGALYCWGKNTTGQLGDGTDVSRHEPRRVDGLDEVRSVAAGRAATCAVTGAGALYCWGDNDTGQLGIGTLTLEERLPQRVADWNDVEQVVLYSHSCAIRRGGALYCWGPAARGQIGDGVSRSESPTPVLVSLPSSEMVTSVDVGEGSTCAVGDGDSVYCWGDNWAGQTGQTSRGNDTPAEVSFPGGIDPVADLSLGTAHACVRAVGDVARIWCWGRNANGQLGRGTTSSDANPIPLPVGGLASPD